MPKIVDHDAYREELARKAIEIFRRRGYQGISLRTLARELGISKSAFYHYFASKKEIFDYCGKLITEFPQANQEGIVDNLPDAITQFAKDFEPNFFGELSLMIDYTRNLSAQEIRDDTGLRETVKAFRKHFDSIVGPEDADHVLYTVFGFLFFRMLGGGTREWRELEEILESILMKPER